MKKSILALSFVVAMSAYGDAQIKTKGDVVYSIDGAQTTSTSAKEGSVIE